MRGSCARSGRWGRQNSGEIVIFLSRYYYSQNEKFTSEKSSTLVLAHLPLTRFVRRNNYPGLLSVLLVKFVEKNV